MVATRTYLIVAGVLLVLLGLTLAVSFLPVGPWRLAVGLLIAGVKASLVAVIFMHLRWSSPVMRLFAVAGLVWLAILLTLTLTDYLTRGPGWQTGPPRPTIASR